MCVTQVQFILETFAAGVVSGVVLMCAIAMWASAAMAKRNASKSN